MTEQTDTKQIDSTPSSAATRRAVIQWLAGVPLIPVVGSTAFSMLASRAAEAGIMAKSVEFIGMPAPTTAAAQASRPPNIIFTRSGP